MRRTSFSLLAVAGLGIALIVLPSVLQSSPSLVWNATASVPVGLYRMVSGLPQRGDFVLVRPPDAIAQLAAERGYLPLGVPLVKRVAALAGDHVCAHGATVSINGKSIVQRHQTDRAGRPLPQWKECRRLDAGEVFLLAEAAESFDSRYFGPVRDAALIGRLVPLWID